MTQKAFHMLKGDPREGQQGHLEDSKPRDLVLWSHVGDVWPSRDILVKLRISTDGRN